MHFFKTYWNILSFLDLSFANKQAIKKKIVCVHMVSFLKEMSISRTK